MLKLLISLSSSLPTSLPPFLKIHHNRVKHFLSLFISSIPSDHPNRHALISFAMRETSTFLHVHLSAVVSTPTQLQALTLPVLHSLICFLCQYKRDVASISVNYPSPPSSLPPSSSSSSTASTATSHTQSLLSLLSLLSHLCSLYISGWSNAQGGMQGGMEGGREGVLNTLINTCEQAWNMSLDPPSMMYASSTGAHNQNHNHNQPSTVTSTVALNKQQQQQPPQAKKKKEKTDAVAKQSKNKTNYTTAKSTKKKESVNKTKISKPAIATPQPPPLPPSPPPPPPLHPVQPPPPPPPFFHAISQMYPYFIHGYSLDGNVVVYEVSVSVYVSAYQCM